MSAVLSLCPFALEAVLKHVIKVGRSLYHHVLISAISPSLVNPLGLAVLRSLVVL